MVETTLKIQKLHLSTGILEVQQHRHLEKWL
jgi:hypothetical protein